MSDWIAECQSNECDFRATGWYEDVLTEGRKHQQQEGHDVEAGRPAEL
jgi:hypothetical protein